MSYLAKLNVTQLKRPAAMTPQEQRRAKLIAKLEEQLAVANAELAGNTFNVTKHVWKTDVDGEKQRVASERVVRPWYWRDGDALQMVVRYGAKVLELSKGKKAISVTTLKDVPTVIGTVLAAVKAGELDAAIEAVVGTRTLKLTKKAG